MPKFLDVTSTSAARTALGVRATAENPTAFFSAEGLTNASVLPVGGNLNGIPYVVTHTGAAGFTVSNGRLTSNSSLAYLNFGPLPGPVQEFWIEVEWTDGGNETSEPVVLIVSENDFASEYPGGGTYTDYSNAGMHMLIYQNRVVYQKRKGDGSATTQLLYYAFQQVLEPGVRHRFGVLWDGNRATVVMPSRETYTIVYDTDVIDWWGRYACVEIVGSTSGNNKINIHSFSCSSEVKRITEPERGVTAIGTPGVATIAQAASVKSPGTQDVALAATYTTVYTKAFRIPASKCVAVTASMPVSAGADGNLSGQMSAAGNPTSIVSTTLLEAQAHTGMITWSGVLDLSGFTVGNNTTLWVRLAHSGTGSFRTSTSGPPRIPTVTIVDAMGTF